MLKGVIRGYGETQKDLADALGISLSSLNLKIKGKAEFRQNEIAMIKSRYGLTAQEVDSIFFSLKLS